MDHSRTSFPDVLTVPFLAELCCSYVSQTEFSGSGLKTLREVNKQLSIGMLDHVKSYTLTLGGPPQHNSLEAVHLLQQTRLSHLSVKLMSEEGDNTDLSALSPLTLRDELKEFVAGMGTSLGTVTTLHLKVRSNAREHLRKREPISAPFTRRLAQLAPAFPSLHTLRLDGCFPEEVLEAFGACCPHLTILRMEPTSLRIPTLRRLQLLLPNVSNLAYHCAPTRKDEPHMEQSYMRTALAPLAASTSITHINLGGCYMEPGMWTYLPSSMKVLSSDGNHLSRGPPPGVCLHNLERISWESCIQGVSELLQAAPKLLAMDCPLEVECTATSLPAWSIICDKVASGLGGCFAIGLNDTNGGEFTTFLAAAKPMLSVSFVDLTSEGMGAELGCLKELSRVFPHMENLTLVSLNIKDVSLQSLLSCKVLRSIDLDRCNSITATGAGMLAARHLSLMDLTFMDCDNIEDNDIKLLEQLVQVYNLQVMIS